ncbi:glycosyl transferase, group 1 family protein [Vibrio ichthyoenteri ATCC 700023]|uniref:Glycosyl transferase, group 1 family protein n=1 Tax=Vibrio ichthyoenteri ATCC 700023 TaxID=870968 RepID=F9S4N9_9VIBR|nr:glycosyltransferase family 4 protein [Vibrio ichthyoenteri]EGU36729.1 glycosyl transferase, group 1 family protein [Vibrio ichthyoenteri ATCC 700023]
MKKKLLFVVNVDWFFVSHRLPIAIQALDEGYEVHLACSVTNSRELIESLGIIVHDLPISRSGTNLVRELITLSALFKVIKKVNSDIIHSVTIKPVIYANIIARVLGNSKRISSISGLGYVFIADGFKAKIFRFIVSGLYKLALTGSDCVIFQNTEDRDALSKLGVVNIHQEVIIRGSGVNLDNYIVYPEPDSGMVVMLVARLLIDKGVHEFVKAAELVHKQCSSVRMVLVGDIDPDNPKSITIDQIKSWVDSNVIEHWGYSYNVSNTMSKANIVVLPSYREGLPKCLIEAAACGRAVITTDVPGCRDAIEVGKTGLLVPPRNIEILAEAIVILVNNNVMRLGFGQNGRLLAESEFRINDVIKKHLDIYHCSLTNVRDI